MRNGLENQLQENQRTVMECVDKIDKLYERLQLDNNQKFNFLAENRGNYHMLLRYFLISHQVRKHFWPNAIVRTFLNM